MFKYTFVAGGFQKQEMYHNLSWQVPFLGVVPPPPTFHADASADNGWQRART